MEHRWDNESSKQKGANKLPIPGVPVLIILAIAAPFVLWLLWRLGLFMLRGLAFGLLAYIVYSIIKANKR
ncbi:MAG TPA: hypothetical protein VF719_09235 [Abditibacteriaceae bacterium]|jgi:hypothetical protein